MDSIFKPKTLLVAKHPLTKALQVVSNEPTCYSQSYKSAEWRASMALEFDALQRHGTWTLVPLKPVANL